MVHSSTKSFNEFISSTNAPLGIEIPQDVVEVYETFKRYEASKDRKCEGGFLYGGAITSFLRGETPRDLDMAITSPEMVELAFKLQKWKETSASSYSESNERCEAIDYITSQMFPYSNELMFNEENLTELRTCPVLGSCFQITATHIGPEGSRPLDILFLKDQIRPYTMFAGRPDAPIRQAAYDFSTGDFVYHKDFPDHAERWLFQPNEPDKASKTGMEKAIEKGMQVIMPETV